eukprot:1145823-Pelagomonas_calceolata.AAC.13
MRYKRCCLRSFTTSCSLQQSIKGRGHLSCRARTRYVLSVTSCSLQQSIKGRRHVSCRAHTRHIMFAMYYGKYKQIESGTLVMLCSHMPTMLMAMQSNLCSSAAKQVERRKTAKSKYRTKALHPPVKESKTHRKRKKEKLRRQRKRHWHHA